MLPANRNSPGTYLKIVQQPSETYRVDKENNRIAGMTDGLEAVRQAVRHILVTERYETLIFSWNYGTELKTLYGRPLLYVQAELKRRIREALTQDDRIKSVDGFEFTKKGSSLRVCFTVHTMKGDFAAEKEVEVNV